MKRAGINITVYVVLLLARSGYCVAEELVGAVELLAYGAAIKLSK